MLAAMATPLIVLLWALALGGQQAGQPSQEPSSSKPPGRGDKVVATGCLMGPTLESTQTVATDQTGRLSTPVTYQLKGDKKVLKQMREQYDAHVVEVTGVLKSDLPQDDALHRTLGKTKVVFGVGTPTAQQNVANQPPAMPVLDVRSFDGTAAPCGK
jgi:hypothetical protein